MRDQLKFKQLLNQFRSLRFEEEYMDDVLVDAHREFDDAFDAYMEENGITTDDFTRSPVTQEVPTEDDGQPQQASAEPPEMRLFKKAHKKLARKIHPDRISIDDPRREEFESDFKKMTTAISDGIWADFFDLVDKYDVDLDRVDEANRLLLEDIDKMSETIEGKKKTFSWFLQQCGDSKDCRDNVIEVYMKSRYGWTRQE